jgi:hypothetical protein
MVFHCAARSVTAAGWTIRLAVLKAVHFARYSNRIYTYVQYLRKLRSDWRAALLMSWLFPNRQPLARGKLNYPMIDVETAWRSFRSRTVGIILPENHFA